MGCTSFLDGGLEMSQAIEALKQARYAPPTRAQRSFASQQSILRIKYIIRKVRRHLGGGVTNIPV